jgi:hypothetical protein
MKQTILRWRLQACERLRAKGERCFRHANSELSFCLWGGDDDQSASLEMFGQPACS